MEQELVFTLLDELNRNVAAVDHLLGPGEIR
jgi:hypothetical protein